MESTRLDDHIEADDKRFALIEENVRGIRQDISLIKDNHLEHLKNNLSDLRVQVAQIKELIDWLNKFFWLVVSASVGSLVVAILNLIMNK